MCVCVCFTHPYTHTHTQTQVDRDADGYFLDVSQGTGRYPTLTALIESQEVRKVPHTLAHSCHTLLSLSHSCTRTLFHSHTHALTSCTLTHVHSPSAYLHRFGTCCLDPRARRRRVLQHRLWWWMRRPRLFRQSHRACVRTGEERERENEREGKRERESEGERERESE